MNDVVSLHLHEADGLSQAIPQKDVSEEEIPDPCGYRLLIALPEIDELFNNMFVKPEKLVQDEQVASVIGLVLDMGPLAYTDKERFPTGPWCKVGDYIIMRAFTGTRIRVRGKEFRFINDDSVEGVVRGDPRLYTRA